MGGWWAGRLCEIVAGRVLRGPAWSTASWLEETFSLTAAAGRLTAPADWAAGPTLAGQVEVQDRWRCGARCSGRWWEQVEVVSARQTKATQLCYS